MYIYLGTFLIALATLSFEVTLTRLLSVITWYHLAFFSVSTAMLGTTAGAVTIYIKPDLFSKEKLNKSVAAACTGFFLAIPCSLILLCLVPMVLSISVMSLFAFLTITFACTFPFYFSGIAITAVLTKHQLPIGKLYASDLIGASMGCLFVLGGLEIFDALSLILLCSFAGFLAMLCFARGTAFKLRGTYLFFSGIIILLILINSFTFYGIRPLVVKNKINNTDYYLMEKWNSFSRVVVYKMFTGKAPYWGGSPVAPKEDNITRYGMNIDGMAATVILRFNSIDDIKHLRYDMVNIAYYLRPNGNACIIGLGGGRDVQSAVLFGQKKIVGIDINPIFVKLLEKNYRKFAGLADRKEISLITDEARSFLSRTKDNYSIIQMSMIDTWAATAAGAYSLSENTLYTVEAWTTIYSRLSPKGIFTVSRWYNPKNLGETGRVLSLAVASLLNSGVAIPSAHIAMVTTNNLSTLLINKEPFTHEDIVALKQICSDLQFNLVIIPGSLPAHSLLKKIVSARSMDELRKAVRDEPLNYLPTTDENPYFFNMLRMNHLNYVFETELGVARGNLAASITLASLIVCLSLLALLVILFPLISATKTNKKHTMLWSGALYFSLIGAGFMFVEIALIQRLSVFLGHPVYALGILLFTIIFSAGIGSLLSEYFPLTRKPWLFIYPLIIMIAIIAIRFILPIISANFITSSMTEKILISILIITPMGMLLGICFPTGMRLVKDSASSDTPWYWALNGIFSVLSSAFAVFISIYFGISISMYIASLCYAMLLLCLPFIKNAVPS